MIELPPDEIDVLSAKITNEIAALLYQAKEEDTGEESEIRDMQPPSSVILAAATAAAQVLIAFERGHRMG